MWPARRPFSSAGSRDSSTRRASDSLRARASAQRSTSPGGKTPNWSRSCPELPPLSNMVTTALTLIQGFCFSPPMRLGRPVPPPKHPMFNCVSCIVRIIHQPRQRRGPRAARTGSARFFA